MTPSCFDPVIFGHYREPGVPVGYDEEHLLVAFKQVRCDHFERSCWQLIFQQRFQLLCWSESSALFTTLGEALYVFVDSRPEHCLPGSSFRLFLALVCRVEFLHHIRDGVVRYNRYTVLVDDTLFNRQLVMETPELVHIRGTFLLLL